MLNLAVVLSGAVSLGAFEAGAVYELVLAEQAGLRAGKNALRVDVLVGSSAGAMTASQAAYCLQTGTDPRSLYTAWVDLASLDRLMPRGEETWRGSSFLSGRAVQELADQVFVPPGPNAGAPAVTWPIRLVVTLTSIEGAQYYVTRRDQSRLPVWSYADAMSFRLEPQAYDPELWDRIKKAAIASGAFPVALPPVPITRQPEDFIIQGSRKEDGEITLTYYDGGVINNRPFGLAVDAVLDLAPPGGPVAPHTFVLIEPDPPELRPQKPHQSSYDMVDVGLAAFTTAFRHDSLYQDFVNFVRVNDRLAIADELTQAVARALAAAGPEAARLLHDELQPRLAAIGARAARTAGVDVQTWVNQALVRSRRRVAMSVPSVQNQGSKMMESLAVMRLLVDMAAGLENKEVFDASRVSPADPANELAGIFFGHFGGFLDRRFREHDFMLGRWYMNRWLREHGITYESDVSWPGDPPRGLAQVSWRTKVQCLWVVVRGLVLAGAQVWKRIRGLSGRWV